jgi:hypothetical protein
LGFLAKTSKTPVFGVFGQNPKNPGFGHFGQNRGFWPKPQKPRFLTLFFLSKIKKKDDLLIYRLKILDVGPYQSLIGP